MLLLCACAQHTHPHTHTHNNKMDNFSKLPSLGHAPPPTHTQFNQFPTNTPVAVSAWRRGAKRQNTERSVFSGTKKEKMMSLTIDHQSKL